MSKFMSNEEIDRTIEGLQKLIDIYATELYRLDQQRPKDAMAIYRYSPLPTSTQSTSSQV